MKTLLAITFLCLYIASCQTSRDYDKIFKDPGLYSFAVHELNTVVMGNNFSPMVASRNYAYASIAAYEVIATGYPTGYMVVDGGTIKRANNNSRARKRRCH